VKDLDSFFVTVSHCSKESICLLFLCFGGVLLSHDLSISFVCEFDVWIMFTCLCVVGQ